MSSAVNLEWITTAGQVTGIATADPSRVRPRAVARGSSIGTARLLPPRSSRSIARMHAPVTHCSRKRNRTSAACPVPSSTRRVATNAWNGLNDGSRLTDDGSTSRSSTTILAVASTGSPKRMLGGSTRVATTVSTGAYEPPSPADQPRARSTTTAPTTSAPRTTAPAPSALRERSRTVTRASRRARAAHPPTGGRTRGSTRDLRTRRRRSRDRLPRTSRGPRRGALRFVV